MRAQAFPLFAEPHPEIRQVREGRTYTRTLGKRCPQCSLIFYTYQVEGQEREPYRKDPEVMLDIHGRPLNGVGTRETCGSPDCAEREDFHQFRRRVEFRANWAKNHPAAKAKDQPVELVEVL